MTLGEHRALPRERLLLATQRRLDAGTLMCGAANPASMRLRVTSMYCTSSSESTVTKSVYDSFGNVKSVTEAFGTAAARTSSYEYDLNNLLTAAVDARGNRTSYAYDAVGNRIRATDARLNSTDFTYDALDRVNGRPYAAVIAAGTDGAGAARQLQRIARGQMPLSTSMMKIRRTGSGENQKLSSSWPRASASRRRRHGDVAGGPTCP